MPSSRSRYPLASHLVADDMLDVLIRMAENTSNAWRKSEPANRDLVVGSMTVVEHAVRVLCERSLIKAGKGAALAAAAAAAAAAKYTDGEFNGPREGGYYGVPTIEAADGGFRGVPALRALAQDYGIGSLTKWLDAGSNSDDLDGIVSDCNAALQSVEHRVFDGAKACAVSRSLVHAMLADHPKDLVAALLIEGNQLEIAGRH